MSSALDREQLGDWTATLRSESFEAVFETLEHVLETLEEGNLPLADTIALYELGMQLNARCQDILDHAMLKISEIDASVVNRQRDVTESEQFRIGAFSSDEPF